MAGFQHKRFDVDVAIALDLSRLSWPRRGEAADESHLGLNRMYFDIRGALWREAETMLQTELDVIQRVTTSSAPDQEMDVVDEEMDETCDDTGEHPLWGLDLGVAGATFALSAAGCIPFTSCNAGAFGSRHHQEAYPLVAFYMRPKVASVITDAAMDAGAGLFQHPNGSLQVYGSAIGHILGFAHALYVRRGQLRRRRGDVGAARADAAPAGGFRRR
jgi:hypothetical protein